jgi:hypothetical protein
MDFPTSVSSSQIVKSSVVISKSMSNVFRILQCNLLQIPATNSRYGIQQWYSTFFCSRTPRCRNAYRLLVGKPKGKSPLGKQRRKWKDNIRMDLGEVGWG